MYSKTRNFLMEMFSILGQKWQLFTETQKQVLMERFKANEYLTRKERHELCMSLNTTEKRIIIWYRRMREKKAYLLARNSPMLC